MEEIIGFEILYIIWAAILLAITITLIKRTRELDRNEKKWINVLNEAMEQMKEQRAEQLKEYMGILSPSKNLTGRHDEKKKTDL